MNLRHIKFLRRKSWFGKLIRLPFRLIPNNKVVSILSGPLKGKKWITGSHNMSILFGFYEKKQTLSFVKLAKEAKVLWDLGSHVGYYSLLFHAVKPDGKSFAFEPMQNNQDFFKKHMHLNGITGFQLLPYATSDTDAMLSFSKSHTSVAGKIDAGGEIKVKAVKLSRLLMEKTILPPDIIKMDIEGAETSVLKDLKSLLIAKHPVLFLSTHGKKVHEECLQILREVGYKLTPLDTTNLETSRELLATRD